MRRPPLSPAEIETQAIPLDAFGIPEDAWTRAAAKFIVESLRGTGIIVLGGDVMRRRRDRIEYTYDSWHYDPVDGDDRDASAQNSYEATIEYLNRYPDSEDGTFLYVLTLDGEDGW